MILCTDYLLNKYFGKTLANKNVEILDPATGTGTFITSIIDHIPKQNLLYKYQNEIHANEVSILPYYVANLNMEFTFKQKMGFYEEFQNLCFVDTLDNTSSMGYGKQHSLFGLSSENTERIRRQNQKKISVVIGNPPYNANQLNENENNKNREYPSIDKRIKDTYIKNSTAQKTKMYDMYARFYRWATDRLDKNGVLSFITNRSFIDSRTFDGFRKSVMDDFNACYIVDTKSDVRANPKIAGTTHNVFGIQTGVAIMFLIKKEKQEGQCKIHYIAMEDEWRKEEKLDWLRNHKFEEIPFENISPDLNNNWINITDNDFDSLIPLCSKDTKLGRNDRALFHLFSNGVQSNRDEWVYDYSKESVENKVSFFCKFYEKEKKRWGSSNKEEKINDFVDRTIKWTTELQAHLMKGSKLTFDANKIVKILYRPFSKQYFYFDKIITHRPYQNGYIFGYDGKFKNRTIYFNVSSPSFCTIAADCIAASGTLLIGGGTTQSIPLLRYDDKGKSYENITDWGLAQFREKYEGTNSRKFSDEREKVEFYSNKKGFKINKEDIFHYVYAVLNNPIYRKKYETNLKRDFPHVPMYNDFWKWSEFGKQLMDLHINYEKAKPFALKLFEVKEANIKANQKEIFNVAAEPEAMFSRKAKVKVKLRADKEAGEIELDEITTLRGIPKEAWEYKLGNRSALEWVLDQYKEKKYSDPTIAEKFNTYQFADYKEQVIDLIKRVTTVSVETVKIINQMSTES